MEPSFTFFEIDLLARPAHHADLEIDDPVLAEAGDRLARLRIQLDQAIAGGDEENRSSPLPSVQ